MAHQHELSATGLAKLHGVKRTLSRQDSNGTKNTSAGTLELQRIKDDLRKSSLRLNSGSNRILSRQDSNGTKNTSAGTLELQRIKDDLRKSSLRLNSTSEISTTMHCSAPALLSQIPESAEGLPIHDKLKLQDISPEEVKAFQREFYKTMGAEKATGASVDIVAQKLVAHGVYPDAAQAKIFVMRMNGSKKKRVTLIDIMNSVRSENVLLQRKASMFVKSVAKSAIAPAVSTTQSDAEPDKFPPVGLKSATPSNAKILIARMNSKDQTFMEQRVFSEGDAAAAEGQARTKTISRLPSSEPPPSVSKKSVVRVSTASKGQAGRGGQGARKLSHAPVKKTAT
jgi:phage protein U